MLQQRGFDLEIKALNDLGEFSGRASVYNVTDLGSDVVEVGAFQKSIREKGDVRPLLWLHSLPIGTVKLRDTAEALWVDGKLTMTVRQAQEAHELMKSGAVKGLSVGYQTVPDRTSFKNGVRYLSEVKLFEVSLTPTPMNEDATVLQVKQLLQKTRQEDDIRRALDSFRSDFERAISGVR